MIIVVRTLDFRWVWINVMLNQDAQKDDNRVNCLQKLRVFQPEWQVYLAGFKLRA